MLYLLLVNHILEMFKVHSDCLMQHAGLYVHTVFKRIHFYPINSIERELYLVYNNFRSLKLPCDVHYSEWSLWAFISYFSVFYCVNNV